MRANIQSSTVKLLSKELIWKHCFTWIQKEVWERYGRMVAKRLMLLKNTLIMNIQIWFTSKAHCLHHSATELFYKKELDLTTRNIQIKSRNLHYGTNQMNIGQHVWKAFKAIKFQKQKELWELKYYFLDPYLRLIQMIQLQAPGN